MADGICAETLRAQTLQSIERGVAYRHDHRDDQHQLSLGDRDRGCACCCEAAAVRQVCMQSQPVGRLRCPCAADIAAAADASDLHCSQLT